METKWYYIIIVLLVIIFLVFIIIVDGTNSDPGVYSEPGVCPYCNTKLAKAVSSNAYHNSICWYCPNEDCPH